ncbi:MAG: OmpA family protein [Pseudomonadota bacterium]
MIRAGWVSVLMALWLAAMSVGGAATAQEEELTPEFGKLEGASLTHFLLRNFDSYKLPAGQFTRDQKPVLDLEGRVRELVYVVEGETSTLEAIRNYQRRFEELNYETVFQCAGDECGGFDFRFNIYLVEPPKMRFDLADFRYLAVSDNVTGRHASILASRQGGKLFVQVVSIEGDAAPESMTAATDAPAPRTKPGEARLFALARLLTEQGHAPLEGIAFEPGSATLIGTSGDALAQAARLLQGRPDLKFLVVGHTDNQGDLEVNMNLSRARAEAVADKLAESPGVERSQLLPHGIGFLSPRASNATEEGRSANRRVELVLQ